MIHTNLSFLCSLAFLLDVLGTQLHVNNDVQCGKLEFRDVVRRSEEAEAEAACLRDRVRHVSQSAALLMLELMEALLCHHETSPTKH